MHGSLSFRTNAALVCSLNSPLVQLCSVITLLCHYRPFEISFALPSSLGELILKGWTCSLSSLTSHLSWNPRLKHTCTLLLRGSVPEQRPTCGFTECFSMVVLYRLWECLVWFLPLSLPSLSLPLSSIPLFYCLCKCTSWRIRQGAKWFYTAINFSFFKSLLIMAFLFSFLLACFSGLKSFLAFIILCLLSI